MKTIIACTLTSLALSGNVLAESSFSYGNLDLSYIKSASDTKLFAADNTDYLSVKSKHRPDGFEAKISVPFAEHFFYELSYSMIEDKVGGFSALGVTVPFDYNLEQDEARIGLGYIYSLSGETDLFFKGSWINGEIADEDFDGWLLGGGARHWVLSNLELVAEAGFGTVEIDVDADLLEFKLGAFYHLTGNIAVGLGYKYIEIDDPDVNDPDLVVIGVEEQQTVQATLRFMF